MSASLKISLMYLLLIIPEHGNNPVPVIDTWLQKDQDDGFVQRDMTSSLTGGDESFGSAHQSYQNSLIRKKKSDTTGTQQGALGYKKFTGKFGQSQAYGMPEPYLDGQYMSDDYRSKLSGSERNGVNFEELGREDIGPSDRYRSKMAYMNNQNDENANMMLFNNLKNDKYADSVPSGEMPSFNAANGFPERSMTAYEEDTGKSAKWSLCKRTKDKYSNNQPMNYFQAMPREGHDSYENLALRNRYADMIAERKNRELENQYKEPVRMGMESDGRGPQIFNENEYYDAELNPMTNEDDVVVGGADYGQMMGNHAFLNKREETMTMQQQQQQQQLQQQQQAQPEMGLLPMLDSVRDSEEAARALLQNSFKTSNDDSYLSQGSRQEITKDDNPNLKNTMNSDTMWNLDSNFQSDALQEVLKNSQKALKEVQFYQQKLASPALKSSDSNENGDVKRDSRNPSAMKWENPSNKFDDKRLKREDEDEQKNMKTGTDEGGGGEYEDEEGKGHKDEEEYYEDADLSDDESNTDIRKNANFNQKYVKREAVRGGSSAAAKNSKETQSDIGSPDYEFNIENAPVENAPEKSRKTSLRREGEKANNNSARKGVKIWDQWGRWSPCSVTCGVGRTTRWRHCIGGGCAQGEKEAQIKRCTNPAC